MLKCVMFDLDGTIADTLPLCIAAFKKALEPLAGRSYTNEEIRATFGPSEEGIIEALLPDRYDEGVSRYFSHYKELHAMCPEPFEGMRDILEEARQKGIRLALITGKTARGTAITLSQFGINSYFDWIETGSPQGSRKVEAIQKVLKLGRLAPRECVYIGDSPSDITETRECGVPIVSAAWAGTSSTEELIALKPDWLFTNLADFSVFMKALIQNPHRLSL